MLGYVRGYKKKLRAEPLKEAKPEYGKKKVSRSRDTSKFVFIVLAVSVIIIVVLLVYALFVFIHNSQMSSIYGVHISQNIKNAIGFLTGTKDFETKGYEGWSIYHDDSFEFKFPSDWKISESDFVVIKKYNKKLYNYFDSLAAVIYFHKLDNPENLELVDYLMEKDMQIGEKKEIVIEGREALRTGVFKGPRGFTRRSIYWPAEGKIYYLEAVFYNKNYEELFEEFEKIVKSVRIF